ncbi:MAG: hypothetical protein ACOCUS_03635 [Polyangiales bacterium]
MALVAAAACLGRAGAVAAESPDHIGVSLPVEGDLEQPSRKMLRDIRNGGRLVFDVEDSDYASRLEGGVSGERR